jgi:hypothetical protein
MSISSDDDTDSTKSQAKYDSALDHDVDMCREDDVDAPDGVDLDCDVDMERDGDDEQEEDKMEEDEMEEVDEEDKDDDDGKEPRTIGQGEMVNTSADDVDTMVDNQPILLPEQGQEMREHTPQPQHLAPAPQPQIPDLSPQPHTPQTHPLSALEHYGLAMPQKLRPAVPTLREAEGAGNTSYVDVDQELLIASAVGYSLPNIPLADVSLPDFPLRNIPVPEERPDGSVGEE